MTKLLDQGLLKEIRVKRGEPHWRVDEDERPIGLKLTRSGDATDHPLIRLAARGRARGFGARRWKGAPRPS